MTTQVGKTRRRQKPPVSESSDEPDTSRDEDVKIQTSTSNLNSSDITDLSGCPLNVDSESDESPPRPRYVRTLLMPKDGTSCLSDSVDEGTSHMVTQHHHREILIRRPIHGCGPAADPDSFIEYSTRCTVVSKRGDAMHRNLRLTVAVVVIGCICLTSLVLGVFFQTAGPDPSVPPPKSDVTPEMFLHAFSNVRDSFRSQMSGFWGVVRAAVKPIVFRENPDQPAVFVLVAASDVRETASCFVHLFGRSISALLRARPPVEFAADAVSELPPERVKRLLDDQLRVGLSSGSRIAVLHHLEQLHAESAMMLHAYCDNENAPFRRAVFILALFVDELSSEISETDSFVEDRLRTLWGDVLGTNRFYPLITRIAHSIVFMRPESSDALAQVQC